MVDSYERRHTIVVVTVWLLISVAACLVMINVLDRSVRQAIQIVSGGTLALMVVVVAAGYKFLLGRSDTGLSAIAMRFDPGDADTLARFRGALEELGPAHEAHGASGVVLACTTARSWRSYGETIVVVADANDPTHFVCASWNAQPTFTFGKNRSNVRRIARAVAPASARRLSAARVRSQLRPDDMPGPVDRDALRSSPSGGSLVRRTRRAWAEAGLGRRALLVVSVVMLVVAPAVNAIWDAVHGEWLSVLASAPIAGAFAFWIIGGIVLRWTPEKPSSDSSA